MYVTVLGQIARDLVLQVARIPDKGTAAPVRERRETLGGKGANIAVGLAQLGVPVALLGVVGDDLAGERVLARAGADGIDTTPVIRRERVTTALIVDLVSDEGWHYLEDIPDATLLTEGDVEAARPVIGQADAVVIQLQQPAAAAKRAAAIARQGGAKVVLDGVSDDESILDLADVVRVDHREGELFTGIRITDEKSGARAARELLKRGPGFAAVAVEEIGNVFAWDDQVLTVPHGDEPVVDTTGAGDAFVAALTRALLRGESPETAARQAVAAAGVTVGRLGGRPDLGSPDAISGTPSA
ncbi:ribokinase [Lentzea sp. NBRC 105346]|uniref:PfkB family carbohydrate kinase n=1 Tax=Lentzea sp. NBRC 105346 TaxID=3032205 RepID=UPI00249FB2AD|nr:PfkB family carbohydrate kinase [Lentzea sp. NBRC 105346]GLZ31672.1 ribokinase [Lentzea sp. NBRC 105346]